MPDRSDNHLLILQPIHYDERRSTDHQLPDSWLSTSPAEARMISQRLDNRDNPHGQTFCGLRFVVGYVSANLMQPRDG